MSVSTRDYKLSEENVKKEISRLAAITTADDSKRGQASTVTPFLSLVDELNKLSSSLNEPEKNNLDRPKTNRELLKNKLLMPLRMKGAIEGAENKENKEALRNFTLELMIALDQWKEDIVKEIRETPEQPPTKKLVNKKRQAPSPKPNNETPFRWWGAAIGFLLPLIGLALCFAYPPAGVSITLGNLCAIGPISALLGTSIGALVGNCCCLPSLPARPAKRNSAGGGSVHPTQTAMAASTAGKQEPQPEMNPDKSQPLLQTGRGVPSAGLALDPADKAAGRQPRAR